VILAKQANFTILFDANAMLRDKQNNWDPSNFKKFLDYNQQRKFTDLMFELGNEPNNYGSK